MKKRLRKKNLEYKALLKDWGLKKNKSRAHRSKWMKKLLQKVGKAAGRKQMSHKILNQTSWINQKLTLSQWS